MEKVFKSILVRNDFAQVHLGIEYSPFTQFVNIHKAWITPDPQQSIQVGVTLSLDEIRQVSMWFQEILLSIEE